ncbi:MAG: GNAT family N-acetyltransferase [Alphaproteobacteria bacterium]|nr:GNAT family N-acetyltransferase [Alphaproteobacteria bacterium]
MIRSERLALRPWRGDEVDDAWALWGDPAVTRRIARAPLTPAQVTARLEAERRCQAEHGVQYWRAETHGGVFVGCAGLHPHPDPDTFELGFHLVRSAWGQGYATELGAMVVRHAVAELGVPRLFAGHHPEHHASRRVLEKLGFRPIGAQYFEGTGLLHPSYELVSPGQPPIG